MNTKWTAIAALVVAGSMAALPDAAHAYTFTEDPANDAGDTLATADVVTAPGGNGSLTAIYGTLVSAANPGTDADLYQITITTPSTFSATTNNAVTNSAFNDGDPLDTALFLFDASGDAIAANDDTNGATVTSTLPVGNSLYATLAPGTYYVGISISGNEPENSNGQLLFAQSDDSTAIRGPEKANNINPATLTDFNLDNYDDEEGSYEIDLTGAAAVPEPSTWMLLAVGGLGAGYAVWRRRAARA
jgi:hypothetical protein